MSAIGKLSGREGERKRERDVFGGELEDSEQFHQLGLAWIFLTHSLVCEWEAIDQF